MALRELGRPSRPFFLLKPAAQSSRSLESEQATVPRLYGSQRGPGNAEPYPLSKLHGQTLSEAQASWPKCTRFRSPR